MNARSATASLSVICHQPGSIRYSERILGDLGVVERQGVDLLDVRPEVADRVHDVHQVLLGERIAVAPRGPAAVPVAARRSLIFHADEREPAVVWRVRVHDETAAAAAETELGESRSGREQR